MDHRTGLHYVCQSFENSTLMVIYPPSFVLHKLGCGIVRAGGAQQFDFPSFACSMTESTVTDTLQEDGYLAFLCLLKII